MSKQKGGKFHTSSSSEQIQAYVGSLESWEEGDSRWGISRRIGDGLELSKEGGLGKWVYLWYLLYFGDQNLSWKVGWVSDEYPTYSIPGVRGLRTTWLNPFLFLLILIADPVQQIHGTQELHPMWRVGLSSVVLRGHVGNQCASMAMHVTYLSYSDRPHDYSFTFISIHSSTVNTCGNPCHLVLNVSLHILFQHKWSQTMVPMTICMPSMSGLWSLFVACDRIAM